MTPRDTTNLCLEKNKNENRLLTINKKDETKETKEHRLSFPNDRTRPQVRARGVVTCEFNTNAEAALLSPPLRDADRT